MSFWEHRLHRNIFFLSEQEFMAFCFPPYNYNYREVFKPLPCCSFDIDWLPMIAIYFSEGLMKYMSTEGGMECTLGGDFGITELSTERCG